MNLWHRIQWDQASLIFPVIAFILIFSVFLLVIYRLLRTPNSQLEHLSALPLEPEKLTHEGRTQPKR